MYLIEDCCPVSCLSKSLFSVSYNLFVNYNLKCYFQFSPIMSIHACITVTQTNLTVENVGPLANL